MNRTQAKDMRWFMAAIAVAVIALDRVTKIWVEKHLYEGQQIKVIPGVFWITHVLNFGAAFSLFDAAKNPALVRGLLIGFSTIAVIVVLALLWRMGRTVSLTSVSLALILGGAIGNLFDRIRFGFVVDFLYVQIVRYHWPDFNVADSAIVVGACLLLLEMLRPQPEKA